MAASGFIANQLHADGGMQKMIESMKKKIDRRFLKGIAASPGIVIGKAHVDHTRVRVPIVHFCPIDKEVGLMGDKVW